MIAWGLVLVLGATGGFANALILESNTLWMPELVWEEGAHGIELGFVGNVAVGMAAALLAWLGVGAVDPARQAVVALAGGLAGATFLSNFMQKRSTELAEHQADALNELSQEIKDLP